ncbi:MAG: hypothetical protein VX015_15240 [Planctomycetota bacterium]|nr:hypothetical protein [Planctomycetota bacterium]
MKSSTLSAVQHLTDALTSLEEAQRALQITAEVQPTWLVSETIGRTKESIETVEVAGAHVAELLRSEEGD